MMKILWGEQAVSRGASRKPLLPSRAPVRGVRLYPVMLLLLLGFIGSGLYQLLDAVQSQPIDRVLIGGEFQHVDREELRQQLQPYLHEGFVAVDLDEIRKQLEAQPWIYQVKIERQWPNQLSIEVIEQEAIAHWGAKAFLNHRGELFEPEKKLALMNLPRLDGPASMTREVMGNYRELSEVLRQQGLVLRALMMDERANWSAVIGDNVNVVLGKDEVIKKIYRFVQVYQASLSQDFQRVMTVDMRYSNGLAVAWRDQGQRG